MNRLATSLAILSSALIGYQLVLMQVLSVVQWHHFAYMIISVALLGFGASGTVIALARPWFIRRFNLVVPPAMIGSGVAMPLAARLAQADAARFDSYVLFADPTQFGALVVTYLLFFIPFFLGALAVGLILVRHAKEAGTYYYANLLGSGLGALTALLFMWILKPALLPPAMGLMAVFSGAILIPRRYRMWLVPATAVGVLICIWYIARPMHLQPSEYKDLSRTLDLPGSTIELEESSPYGLVQVVSAEALRHAPGLSLAFRGEIPVRKAVFNNGNWYGPVTAADSVHILDYSTAVLPYVIGSPRSVLDLDAGTAGNTAQALANGAERVTLVEPHGAVVSLLRNELAADTDSLLHLRGVTVHHQEPRTYLAASDELYDLITRPIVGAFGGTLGLTALQEQYGLTVESFELMWRRLEADGMISVTSWMDHPYRNPLKLLATLVEALERADVDHPPAHIAAVRSWGTVTYVVRRTPLYGEDIARVREAANRLSFDPLLLPDISQDERNRRNVLEDARFFMLVDRIVAGDRDLFGEYDFRIKPATDNRPYFSHFLKWGAVPELLENFEAVSLPFIELGTLITAATFVQIVFAAIILIILPLFSLRWWGGGKTWTLLYFSGLGLGYLFVEMVLIQRFVLYLGHPIYAVAAVLAAILIFSGVGSAVSQRIQATGGAMASAAGLVVVLVIFYALFLLPFIDATIALPLLWKGLLTLLIVAFPAFVMGMPFPLGLRRLRNRRIDHLPWAWAVNGCVSVVSAALAALLSLQFGFVAVMLIAAGAYGMVAVVSALAR